MEGIRGENILEGERRGGEEKRYPPDDEDERSERTRNASENKIIDIYSKPKRFRSIFFSLPKNAPSIPPESSNPIPCRS